METRTMQVDGIKRRFAVLVVSCDAYSDLWRPFFTLFRRNWPDCPFRVYLLGNSKWLTMPHVTNILTGEDVSWSDNLRHALKMIEEDYVLLFIEDLFLMAPVDTRRVAGVFKWALKAGANCVRMNPSPPPDRPCNQMVGTASPGTVYRTSTVMTLWKKDTLFDLLKPGESAWDFEVRGSVRSDGYGGFYAAWERHFPIENTVIKSKWRRGCVNRLKSLKVDIDLTKRKIMTHSEALAFYMKQQRSMLFGLVPARYRRPVKDIMMGGKYNYRAAD